ncbi:hypothetical protein OAL15_03695 [Flavobacteriales bacterium]|nr:hypothetical protein [Flavobacteriales bacterium]
MNYLIPLLLCANSVFNQDPCNDFLMLMGQRDTHNTVIDFKEKCGPFEEKIELDGMSKTWTSEEKGIIITLVNRAKNHSGITKFEVMSVELRSFTNKGGFKGDFPFGFRLGMDHKMVKCRIMELKSVDYEKKKLTKKSSSFTYTDSPNSALQNRQIKIYVSQFDGRSISSIRLRLK